MEKFLNLSEEFILIAQTEYAMTDITERFKVLERHFAAMDEHKEFAREVMDLINTTKEMISTLTMRLEPKIDRELYILANLVLAEKKRIEKLKTRLVMRSVYEYSASAGSIEKKLEEIEQQLLSKITTS